MRDDEASGLLIGHDDRALHLSALCVHPEVLPDLGRLPSECLPIADLQVCLVGESQPRWRLRELDRRLREQIVQRLKGHQNRFATLEARLRLLSPTNVLERGYSITSDAATGKVIRDAGEVSPGQPLKTRLKKGEIRSVVAD